MSDNPYTPTGLEETPPAAAEGEVVYASQNKRFLNFILDFFFFYVGTFACGVGLGLAMAFGFLEEQMMGQIAGFVAYPIYFGYFILF